jgi:hypothetical protein
MKAVWGLSIGIGIILFLSLVSFHVLQIKAVGEGKVVYIRVINSGDRFATKYIHSVEKSPVWEFFTIDDHFRIVLYQTIFSSCNTGLPYAPFGDEEFYNNGTQFRIANMKRVVPELLLWVHEKYENTLRTDGSDDLLLASLSGNTLLQVSIRKVTMLEFVSVKTKLFLMTDR